MVKKPDDRPGTPQDKPADPFTPNVVPTEIPLMVVADDGVLVDPRTGKRYRYAPEKSIRVD